MDGDDRYLMLLAAVAVPLVVAALAKVRLIGKAADSLAMLRPHRSDSRITPRGKILRTARRRSLAYWRRRG